MAVSRTFVRGINCSAFSNSLLRPSSTTSVSAASGYGSHAYSTSSSQQTPIVQASSHGFPAVAGPSSQPAVTAAKTASSARSVSSSARKSDDAKQQRLRELRFEQEELEKSLPKEDLGHKTDDGQHRLRTLKSFSLENKVCVITGGARGLGYTMALGFIESGSDTVAIMDLTKESAEQACEDLRNWFEEHNGKGSSKSLNLLGVGCNIADEQSVKQTFKEIHDHYGRLDVVVNSAGIVDNAPAEEYSTDRYRKLMDINLNGSWYVATEAGRYMMQDKNKDASIILVASMSASIVNVPQLQTPYNVSKAGVKHLASCLGVEWASKGIRVNSIAPGYMATALTKAMFEANPEGRALKSTWESLIPSRRMGDPEDLKGAAVFLASNASRYVTATDLVVDGGYCAV